MELDTDKINELLDGRSLTWLAEKIGVSQQTLSYRIKYKRLIDADKIAKVFNISPRSLVIFNDKK